MAMTAITKAGLPQDISFPLLLLLAQAFDFLRQPVIGAGHVSLHVRQPAIDVAEAGTDVASGAPRVGAHALPEFLLLTVLAVEFSGLHRCHPDRQRASLNSSH